MPELFKYSYNASPNFPFRGLIALHHNISLLHEADGPLQHTRIWEWSARQKWLFKGTHPRWHWLLNLYSFSSYRLGDRRDIEEHHEKYAVMIGYEIKLPGGLDPDMEFSIYNKDEILDNDPKKEAREGELRTKLAKLRLNPVCHSRETLLLPGQVLGGSVTTMDRNGRKREEILSASLSCFRSYSEPYFINEKNVRLLERVSLNGSNGVYDKNTSRLPIRGSHQDCDYGVPDPDNLLIRQQHSVSSWKEKGDE